MNLRADFLAALDASGSPDPHDVVADFVATIPASKRVAMLVEAIHLLTPMFAQNARRKVLAPGSCKKAEGLNEYRFLNARFMVGNGVYKFLRDMSADDLLAAALIRREHAKAELERADWLETIAGRLHRAGVVTVGDLPDAELKDLAP